MGMGVGRVEAQSISLQAENCSLFHKEGRREEGLRLWLEHSALPSAVEGILEHLNRFLLPALSSSTS